MRAARRDTKFVVVLADGMADFPLEGLGGKTPLEVAHTPNMDLVADRGVVGQIEVIPATQPAGSDVGNLSVLGYDPERFLTGRAPLEAASMGIAIAPSQVAFRCNLVTLDGELMGDYSAGHISSEEAAELIAAVQEALGAPDRTFYRGVQYRHILLTDGVFGRVEATPPHDIMGQPYRKYLPKGPFSDALIEWIFASQEVLDGHAVNQSRRRAGKSPANSIWLWGQGKAPSLPTYPEKYGVSGSAISAVDLVRGIARYAGLDVLDVPGITGYLDTNYAGKAIEGLRSLRTGDFVYIHVEAPDEAAHLGDPEAKIAAIEAIDREIIARVLDYMEGEPRCRIAVLPDHVTAIATRTHAHGPVPFAACGVGIERDATSVYSESVATNRVASFSEGHRWMDWFLGADDAERAGRW